MLRGPFAAAIWDPRNRSLTLARDHLGLNVVMWHKASEFFAFASMPNGLFALDDVPREFMRGEIRRFPRAQSCRSCNHRCTGTFSGFRRRM